MIREARIDDAAAIVGLIRDLAVYERLEGEVVMTEEDIRRDLFGERRYAEALIAEEGGEAVGFALFFHNYSTFKGRPGIYLEDLFVKPDHRGHGHGRALLARLAALALERGCARLEWAVPDWNEPSIQFYKSLGAVALDDWTTYRVTGEALSRLSSSAS